MIRIREIDHVVLRVRKLEDMLDFYCNALGCRIEKQLVKSGLIQLRAGTCLLDLVPVDSKLGRAGGAAPGTDGLNMDHFCFRIDPFDVSDIIQHLSRHGIEAGEVAPRYGAEGSGPSIYINDPDGNTVELKGPPNTSFQIP